MIGKTRGDAGPPPVSANDSASSRPKTQETQLPGHIISPAAQMPHAGGATVKLGGPASVPPRLGRLVAANRGVCIGYGKETQSAEDVLHVTSFVLKNKQNPETAEQQTLACLKELRQLGIAPDDAVSSAAIAACRDIDAVEKMVALLKRDGAQLGVSATNAMIKAYRRAGRADEAIQLFETMEANGVRPDILSYNSVISACGDAQRPKEAMAHFEHAKKVLPDKLQVVSFNAAIAACEKGANGDPALVDRAIGYFEEMPKYGLQPNAWTFNTLISACMRGGKVANGHKYSREMQRLAQKDPSFAPDAYTYTARISVSSAEQAVREFEEMKHRGVPPTVASYNAVIRACKPEQAIRYFDEMKKNPDTQPDAISYTAVITSCGTPERAVAYFEELQRSQHARPSLFHYKAVIGACVRGGKVRMALDFHRTMEGEREHRERSIHAKIENLRQEKVKSQLVRKKIERLEAEAQSYELTPDLPIYDSLISGCASAANMGGEAFHLIEEAIANGVFHPALGCDSANKTLDFHVATLANQDQHGETVSGSTALAIFDYHYVNGTIDSGFEFIVGQHGDDTVKSAIEGRMKELGWHPVVPPQNPGRLASAHQVPELH